jgi:hypothetical protein
MRSKSEMAGAWRSAVQDSCRLSLSESAEAHRLLESGNLFGKVVLQP